MELQTSTIIKIVLGLIVVVAVVWGVTTIFQDKIFPYFETEPEIRDISTPEISLNRLNEITRSGKLIAIVKDSEIYYGGENGESSSLHLDGRAIVAVPGLFNRAWNLEIIKRDIYVGQIKYRAEGEGYGVIYIYPEYFDETKESYSRVKQFIDMTFLEEIHNAVKTRGAIYQNE